MQWFYDLKIFRKFILTFAIILILTGMVGYVGIVNIKAIDDLDKQLYEKNVIPLSILSKVIDDYHSARIYMRETILLKDRQAKIEAAEKMQQALKRVNDNLKEYEKTLHSEGGKKAVEELLSDLNKISKLNEQVTDLAISGKENTATEILNEGIRRQLAANVLKNINILREEKEKSSKQLADSNTTVAEKTISIMFGVIVFSLMVSVFFAWLLTKVIVGRVVDLNRAVERAATGDLTEELYVWSFDEIGMLRRHFKELVTHFRNVLTEIHGSSALMRVETEKLSGIAEVLAINSEDTNEKTNEVGAAIEEITASIDGTAIAAGETSLNIGTVAAAIEQMSATVRSTAASAEQTSVGVSQAGKVVEKNSNNINNIAGSAKEVTNDVDNIVTAVKEMNISLNEVSKNCERSISITCEAERQADETTVAIDKLNSLSKQIGKIVGVINDIADQTNMLALNAAIEAAGAGEAGKGFAVVANEVKELARQTAEATDEIGKQIENMQSNMNNAVGAVSGITKVIDEITDISNAIASAVTEQSATTGEISKAVIQTAEKVAVITKEIGLVDVGSQDVLRNTQEAGKGVNELARSAAEISVASKEIAENSGKATTRVAEVARATKEIKEGAEDIARSAMEISVASADTANRATETSFAAKNMTEIAIRLEELVKQFKLKE